MSLIIEKKNVEEINLKNMNSIIIDSIRISDLFESNYNTYKEFSKVLLERREIIWGNRFDNLAFNIKQISKNIHSELFSFGIKFVDNKLDDIKDFSKINISEMIDYADDIEEVLICSIENLISDIINNNLYRFNKLYNIMLEASCVNLKKIIEFKRLNNE